jgi:hypothetical protein
MQQILDAWLGNTILSRRHHHPLRVVKGLVVVMVAMTVLMNSVGDGDGDGHDGGGESDDGGDDGDGDDGDGGDGDSDGDNDSHGGDGDNGDYDNFSDGDVVLVVMVRMGVVMMLVMVVVC